MATALSKPKSIEEPDETLNGGSEDSTFESRHAETRRRMLEFLSDPDVMAKYGHLLTADGPEWEEDDSDDEVPDERCREATRKLREKFHARTSSRH